MKRLILLLALLLTLCACQTEPEKPAPKVRTDWSKLDTREPFTPIGSRWYADYTDTLIPCDDYGMLVPYAGARLSDDWMVADGCLYGLMTADGTVVTDPVFPSVYRPGWYENGINTWAYHTHLLLILTRGNRAGEQCCAIAAADGSWCTDFSYRAVCSDRDGLLLFADDGITLMAPDGSIADAYTKEALGLSDEAFRSLLDNAASGEGFYGWHGDYIEVGFEENGDIRVCYQRSTGQTVKQTLAEWDRYVTAQNQGSCELYHRREETAVILDGVTYSIPHEGKNGASLYGNVVVFGGDGAVYRLDGTEIFPAIDGYADFVSDALLGHDAPGIIQRYERQTETGHYYRTDGTPLPFLDPYSPYGTRQMGLSGGLVYTLDHDIAAYYDLNTLECVFRTSLAY